MTCLYRREGFLISVIFTALSGARHTKDTGWDLRSMWEGMGRDMV